MLNRMIFLKITQKILARILKSSLILENPYIDFTKIENNKKTNFFLKSVTIDSDSKLLEEATVCNLQNDKSRIAIGKKTMIRGELLLFKFGGKIEIGNNSYIGKDSRIWSADNVKIGNNVLISHNCNIIDTDSHEINGIERSERYIEMIEKGHWETQGNIKVGKIEIKDYAWISFGVTILKGVTIGKGAIIGANSVVTKDVPDWTIVAGNPAKIIRIIPENER